jgi:hypothetical protein
MAKVICTELQKDGASGPNITLDTSKNVTCENNLQVDGNVTVTGTLPADKLTGALPAISGANLTGLSSSPPANRNIFINGDMRIAQKSTSAVTDQGHQTTDRFYYDKGGTDETPTQERRALSSSDTGPWAKGFKYCFKVTNGNQTGGVGATDYVRLKTTVEARDIFNSGWLYNDASSKLTVSFWVRSSVAQRFYLILRTEDGTGQNYGIPFTISSANTWQKVTHSIPGHANLTFNDDNGTGLMCQWLAQIGSSYTNDSFTDNAWAAYSSGSQCKDYSGDNNNWYETNDATFELTGCQLEVADSATDFEFRSYGDELRRCQRYFYVHCDKLNDPIAFGQMYLTSDFYGGFSLPVTMRSDPSLVYTGGTDYFAVFCGGHGRDDCDALDSQESGLTRFHIVVKTNLSLGNEGDGAWARTGNANAFVALSAEF